MGVEERNLKYKTMKLSNLNHKIKQQTQALSLSGMPVRLVGKSPSSGAQNAGQLAPSCPSVSHSISPAQELLSPQRSSDGRLTPATVSVRSNSRKSKKYHFHIVSNDLLSTH